MEQGPDVYVSDRVHALVIVEDSFPIAADVEHSDRAEDHAPDGMNNRQMVGPIFCPLCRDHLLVNSSVSRCK